MKTLEQIAALNWGDASAQGDLELLVLPVVESIPEPGVSTSELMRRMGAKSAIMKGLANQLGTWRKDNPDYVTLQAKPGAFGKPAYLWHAPRPKAPMSREDRLAAIKASMDPEDFAAIYGDKA